MSQKIAVDAMGGDHAPREVIRGAIRAVEQHEDIEVTLIGDEKTINEELRISGSTFPFEIVHTDEWVGMDEDPKEAVNKKKKLLLISAHKW